MMGVCRLCGATGDGTTFQVREMMFGTREAFEYEQCGSCASVQIRAVPADLGQFYPENYYAHRTDVPSRAARVRERLMIEWTRWILRAPAPLFALLRRMPFIGPRTMVHELTPLRGRLLKEHRIADVGGGAGRLLRRLRVVGFHDLTCVDPFIRESTEHGGVRFRKAALRDLDERFDVIMYHHAMEHVQNIEAELRVVADRLTPTGIALIRVPLVPNGAYARYGVNWVQLDAPRHLHVPSRAGFAAAAQRAGLRVAAQGDDSTMFQFWASELYERGISWQEGAPRFRTLFSAARLREFERAARAANAGRTGDQGWFLVATAER